MARPRKKRCVRALPRADLFEPAGVPVRDLVTLVLPLEGLEALRLAEVEALDQETAAARMGVSRQTFGRVLAEARRIVARVLVEGLALRIEGGDVQLAGVRLRCRCCDCDWAHEGEAPLPQACPRCREPAPRARAKNGSGLEGTEDGTPGQGGRQGRCPRERGGGQGPPVCPEAEGAEGGNVEA